MRLLLFAWLASAAAGRSPPHRLTEAEAVATAETFVRVNGYVDPADADPRAVSLERSLTNGTTPEELLPPRMHDLLPRACGVLPRPLLAFDRGWSVVFCFDPRNASFRESVPDWSVAVRERARVVIMNGTGRQIFVAHPDYSREAPGVKRLPGMAAFESLLATALSSPPCSAPAAPKIDPRIAPSDVAAVLALFERRDRNNVVALRQKGSVIEAWLFAGCGIDSGPDGASLFRLRKRDGVWRIVARAELLE